jgi:antitoxin (DNA-binding transcriptional repressor) of toxin-antitoxin stability system
VAARRLILAMLVLLVLSSVLAALVPVERNRLNGESSTSTTTEAAPPAPSGELVRRTIAADDATPERIGLALGDQLELTVTSAKLADQVEIPAFGALDDVDPDFPARFDLLAVETGSFRVRLTEAGRVIARIDVGPTARDQGKGGEPGGSEGRGRSGSSSDSPGNSTDSSTSGATSLS